MPEALTVVAGWLNPSTFSLIGILLLWQKVGHLEDRMSRLEDRMSRLETKMDQVIMLLLAQAQGKQVNPADLAPATSASSSDR